MNTLISLAQIESQLTQLNDTTVNEAAFAGFGIGLILLSTIFIVALYVVYALLLGRIFKKAGLAQWPAWVPVYNSWKLLEIGGQKGFWSLFMLIGGIPVVGLLSIVTVVFMYISMYHIGKKLGKDGSFVLWAIFLPIVWFIWLATDKSTWKDSASTAPSLATGPKPAAPSTPAAPAANA